MTTNHDPYDDITEYLDWVIQPPDEVVLGMNAVLDSKADLREDCD